jgi:ankyrin repeat protein
MHRFASLLVSMAMVISLTAFLPGLGPADEGSAQAALSRKAVPVESLSLLEAVRAGDRELADLLLCATVKPDPRDEVGRIPLMLALHGGRPNLTEDLIASGADLRRRDPKGDSVLGYAGKAGESSEGGRVVVEAVKMGRPASVKVLLEAGASVWSSDAEKTPLIVHASEREVDWTAERLVARARGVRTTVRNATGGSLGHALVRGRSRELLRLICNHGLEMNAVTAKGETAVHLALLEGRTELLSALLEGGASAEIVHPTGWQPVHLALQRGDVRALRTLLAHGANPNGKGANGRAAMDLALALESTPDEMAALLKAGADPDARGPDGRNAIDILLARRDFASAKLLLAHGADPGVALYNSVVEGDRETFSFLLESGIAASGTSKDPILVAAVREGHAEMVAMLLKAGASEPDQKGREGQRALHLAVAMDRSDLSKLLLEAGADPNLPFSQPASKAFLAKVRAVGYLKTHLRYDSRVTPLMAAADCGNLELARLLIEHGARKHIWTKRKSYYPIGFASRRDDVKMMQLLLGVDPDHEERWVKVDLSEQKAWVYDKGGIEIFTTKISSGKEGYRTKTGEYVITNKNRHHVSNVYKGSRCPTSSASAVGTSGFTKDTAPTMRHPMDACGFRAAMRPSFGASPRPVIAW